MLAGWTTFLDGRHSFCASSKATPPLPFLTGTQHDESLPSNPAVQTVKDLHHAGAAMFTRSTHGCGILAGPRPEMEGFWLQKQKGSADSPGLKHPSAHGRHGMPARWPLKRYDKHIPGICLAYSWHIHTTYIFWVKSDSSFCWIMQCLQPWKWTAYVTSESWLLYIILSQFLIK
jgi:hypothetical protein